MTNASVLSDLSRFTGTEHWYRHGINRDVLYTDGAKYVADAARAYWLLDVIALAERYEKRVRAEEFQVWTLTVRLDQTALLTCADGNNNIVFTKEFGFTDFPPPGVVLWFENNTIYLPSEH